jgi:hypothetical protein
MVIIDENNKIKFRSEIIENKIIESDFAAYGT